MDTALAPTSRIGLIFEGNGATLRSNGNGKTSSGSLFVVWHASHVVIRDFNLVGNSTTPGYENSSAEWAYGVLSSAATNTEIANVHISNVYGDCVNVDGWDVGLWFHDSTCTLAGRQGFAIVAGTNVTIERVTFTKYGGGQALDIEPYQTTGGANGVVFRNNTVNPWPGTSGGPSIHGFFAADGIAGSVVQNVTVTGNVIHGGQIQAIVTRLPRRQNIVFTNNTSDTAYPGAVLQFAHIDGLTVTGNVQPLLSGSLANVVDCTGVTYR
jgi:hypothetical protein